MWKWRHLWWQQITFALHAQVVMCHHKHIVIDLHIQHSTLWWLCFNILKAIVSVHCMTLIFWTFHIKSHNMKALVILSHSWSPFLPLTCLYGTNELLWVSVWSSGVFSWEKTTSILPMQIIWLMTTCGQI